MDGTLYQQPPLGSAFLSSPSRYRHLLRTTTACAGRSFSRGGIDRKPLSSAASYAEFWRVASFGEAPTFPNQFLGRVRISDTITLGRTINSTWQVDDWKDNKYWHTSGWDSSSLSHSRLKENDKEAPQSWNVNYLPHVGHFLAELVVGEPSKQQENRQDCNNDPDHIIEFPRDGDTKTAMREQYVLLSDRLRKCLPAEFKGLSMDEISNLSTGFHALVSDIVGRDSGSLSYAYRHSRHMLYPSANFIRTLARHANKVRHLPSDSKTFRTPYSPTFTKCSQSC